jgi:FeS assembly protein IscX
MGQELMWGDAEDIGIRLHEEHPDLDPLVVRFTDLHAWVVALPEFKDDPKTSNEKNWKPFKWHGMRSIRTLSHEMVTIRFAGVFCQNEES